MKPAESVEFFQEFVDKSSKSVETDHFAETKYQESLERYPIGLSGARATSLPRDMMCRRRSAAVEEATTELQQLTDDEKN